MTHTSALIAILKILQNYKLIDDTGHISNCGVDEAGYCRCGELGVEIHVVLEKEYGAKTYTDKAYLIREEDITPWGTLYMVDYAFAGWYLVKTEDPSKQDLYLPAHIFNKCFKRVGDDYPDGSAEGFFNVEEK